MNNEGAAVGENGSHSHDSSDLEEDEQDEPSSSTVVVDPLDSFREQWQRELQVTPRHEVSIQEQNETKSIPNGDSEETVEEKAKQLFLMGVQHEQDGKLYEAIQFYRRAVQLVPDIEWRLYEASKSKQREAEQAADNLEGSTEDTLEDPETASVSNEESDDGSEDEDMMTHLQRWYSRTHRVCQPHFPHSGVHISALPMELVLHILRWVVSAELDMRSLDLCCAGISRGFYLASRDPEIWRLACVRVWGVNCGGLSNYASWRDMFIERPRLNYHGCYISKTTYIRHGENSFQDQFYRPWHLVEYYRYLRFFPEGVALMLTTPDDPSISLRELRSRHPRNATVLKGHYRLHDGRVTLVLKRQDDKSTVVPNNRIRSGRKRDLPETAEQTFHLELLIQSYRRKRHCQLIWQCYSVITKAPNGTESSTKFDLVNGRFPAFWFSCVKSYTGESESILQ